MNEKIQPWYETCNRITLFYRAYYQSYRNTQDVYVTCHRKLWGELEEELMKDKMLYPMGWSDPHPMQGLDARHIQICGLRIYSFGHIVSPETRILVAQSHSGHVPSVMFELKTDKELYEG